jgi:outer membrane murein-binding lipoprotein Lpp
MWFNEGMALTKNDKQFIAEAIVQSEQRVLKVMGKQTSDLVKLIDGVEGKVDSLAMNIQTIEDKVDKLQEDVAVVVSADYEMIKDHEKRIGVLEGN